MKNEEEKKSKKCESERSNNKKIKRTVHNIV